MTLVRSRRENVSHVIFSREKEAETRENQHYVLYVFSICEDGVVHGARRMAARLLILLPHG